MTDDNAREMKDSYLRLRSFINSDGKYIIWMNEDDEQMWADLNESTTLGERPLELREQALSDLRALVLRIRELEKENNAVKVNAEKWWKPDALIAMTTRAETAELALTEKITALDAMDYELAEAKCISRAWFIREVRRCIDLGMLVGCCAEWPECSHVVAWVEQKSQDHPRHATVKEDTP